MKICKRGTFSVKIVYEWVRGWTIELCGVPPDIIPSQFYRISLEKLSLCVLM